MKMSDVMLTHANERRLRQAAWQRLSAAVRVEIPVLGDAAQSLCVVYSDLASAEADAANAFSEAIGYVLNADAIKAEKGG